MTSQSKWIQETGHGNPTQSKKIDQLVAAVKKHETRGNGAESKEDRPFTDDEFKMALALVDDKHEVIAGVK